MKKIKSSLFEEIRTYKNLRAARIAASQLHKRGNVARANVFRKSVTDRRRKDYGMNEPAVFISYKMI